MARLPRLLRLLVPIVALVGLTGTAHAASTLNLSGGNLTFTAAAGESNDLTIRVSGPNIEFQSIQSIAVSGSCAGSGTTYVQCADNLVTSITVSLGDEDDTLTIESIADPLTADTGADNDTIVLGTVAPPIKVEGIRAALTLDGSAGTDRLEVNDTQSQAASIVTVTSTRIGDAGPGDTFFGANGQASYSEIENVALTTGSGSSLIRVLGTALAASTAIDAGPGDDVFQLSSDGTGSTGDLDGVLGSLSLLGGTGTNALIMSDADASSPNTATLSATSISGLAPTAIQYSATGSFGGGLVVRASMHGDVLSVTGTLAGATTDIRTLGGNDTVLVSSDGSGAGGDLSTFLGNLTLDLGLGANALSISDAGETGAGANSAVSISPTAITGLAGPGDTSQITIAASGGSIASIALFGSASGAVAEAYTIADVAGPLSLAAAGGADSITLQRATHAVNVQAGDGDDTVSLGSAGATLDEIISPVTIDGGNGTDQVVLNDSADPSADIVGVTAGQVGAEPGNSLFGSGAFLSYSAVEQLTLNLGTGSDSVTISATASGAATTVNAGAGGDFLLVPGAAANLDSILGPLTLDGGQGFNSLVLNDANDPSGDTVNVNASTMGGGPEDSLFGPGGSLAYANFTLVALGLGTGDDRVSIEGSPAASISTGDGNDTVALGHLAALTGTIDAGAGIDTLSYEFVNTPVTVQLGIGAAHATSGVEGFENVTGGNGSDTLTGLDESPSELIGGPGNDVLIGGTGRDRLDGGAGSDLLDGGSGNDSYAVGGGTDRIIDAGGKDTLDFSGARRGVRIDISKTGKKRRQLGSGVGWIRLQAAIENVIGSKFSDRIVGNGLRNVLDGRGGNDALSGAAANDRLIGGTGIDRVVESADKNFKLTSRRLTGRGVDRLRSIERATIEGGPSDNRIVATKFMGRVILRGGSGDDVLRGGRMADLLVGEDGDDVLTGGRGRDQIVGGAGNDQLFVKDGARDVADAGIGYDRATTDSGDRLKSVEYRLG